MHSRLLATLLFCVSSLFATDPAPVPASATPAPTPTPAPDPAIAMQTALKKLTDKLTYRQGETVIGKNLAKISVPEQFRYLDAKDAEIVLSSIWGNPKSDDTLGALVPAGFDPLGDETWLVVITYRDEGYVKDDDAAKIDYAKMLTEMQASTRETNQERVKEGYDSVELVGWAKPPRYDAATHKIYWAKELKFNHSKENTLNYNIRVLGRGGYLELNAVASMSQLALVETATPTILSMVNFQEGQRYADYKPSTDKTATYGLAALVAGGVAAKVGLFKGLWIGILALKKFIILGLIALAGSIKKFFAWIRGRHTAEPTEPPATG